MQHEIKAGLEIHQQLDTHKLFCHCPSILRNDISYIQIKRKLHAVAGESGEIDAAVKHEAERDKEFLYQGYDTTCLVELDEEPPHLLNQEALEIALHAALLLHCEIVPITQIMRKIVIDGSNTSGFQRTCLIARNGFVDTQEGKVRIENISLEEDAARIIEKEDGKTIFRLDRLGIPLIEIGTAPDITSAEQCKQTALALGDILRSCKVKRGIGTIRQDINISIPNHPRVEIKGFQDVKMFVPTITNEIKRQKENITNKKMQSEVRNALVNGKTEFLRPMPGSARMYPETDLPLIYISRDIINHAKKTLPQLRSEQKEELEKKGLSQDEARLLLKQGLLDDFHALLNIIPQPQLIFKALIEFPKEIAARYKKPLYEINQIFSVEVLENILQAIKSGKHQKENLKHIMEEIVKGNSITNILAQEKIDMTYLEEEIAAIVKEKPGLTIGGYMGLIMQKFKGVSGNDAHQILKKLLQ